MTVEFVEVWNPVSPFPTHPLDLGPHLGVRPCLGDVPPPSPCSGHVCFGFGSHCLSCNWCRISHLGRICTLCISDWGLHIHSKSVIALYRSSLTLALLFYLFIYFTSWKIQRRSVRTGKGGEGEQGAGGRRRVEGAG